ncbi:MAG: DUF4384 domain-containing protein [Alistipes sp.]|nr:DUF4384 domain-containing protein [Alistipes sp.]
MRLIWQIILLALVCPSVSAQRVRTASGTYTYYVPGNVTKERAEIIAFDRLRVQIIAEHFGTIVGSSNFTHIENESGRTNSQFVSIGESEVKGEWIETVGRPKYSYAADSDGNLIVSVSATGRIRELVSTPVDFTAYLLRNGITEQYASEDFKENDKLYMQFASPIAGYLAVFLCDGEGNVYRMLPYSGQNDEAMHIEKDKSYTFFSLNNADYGVSPDLIDEYMLSCSKRVEYNRIYIIFSPKNFTRPIDGPHDSPESLRVLSYEAFQKWLVRNRVHDSSMRVAVKNITINKS